MFMMNMDFMRSLAVSAILAVLMTMFSAITLLPAMLGFVGWNIDSPHWRDIFGIPGRVVRFRPAIDGIRRFVVWFVTLVPRIIIRLFKEAPPPFSPETFRSDEETRRSSFWYRWSRVIQAHPWPALIISTGVLLLLASPIFALRLGFADAGNRSEIDTTRRAYDLLSEGFGPGFNAPFLIVVDTPAGAADLAKVQQLSTAIRNTEGVQTVAEPSLIPAANLAIINVFPTTSFQDAESTELVHRLRDQTLPPVIASTGLQVYTSGGPPIIVDFSDYIAERLPLFMGAVLLLSFLLLLTVFHSLVVPIKAVIMNMLSIGASFGAMVAVFQWGIGADIIGLGKEGPIEAWAPMMLFAIVFGLSMDYEVFLLTRVREEYDRTGDNGRAVADGLAATGRVISAAAAIMVCVFSAFILNDERAVKLLGFGLAFAILIDATIVRLILVPSAMELLGNRNWWAPRWLLRYLPTIRVDTVEHPVPEAQSAR
jgi:RND superfamily putative drug exporter